MDAAADDICYMLLRSMEKQTSLDGGRDWKSHMLINSKKREKVVNHREMNPFLWQDIGSTNPAYYDEFCRCMKGKTFWEIEKDTEWVDD